MLHRPRADTDPVPDPLGPLARHLAPSPPDDRTFARRRLASLAGVLALVLAVAPLVGGDDDAVDVTTASAASEPGTAVVRAASFGSPSEVRELLSETTTTLVEATGATTSTTAPSTTSTSEAPGEDDEAPDATSTTTEATSIPAPQAQSSTTAAAPTTTEAPARRAPTTTAAPRPAPTTTAAPTTTTAPPPPASSEPSGGGYAYDDPRSTQVWYDLADCESGGNWSIDTGNGYYGGLQFALATWESVGGTGYPHEHPAATQIDFGRTLQARQGWGAWPHCSEKLGLR